MDYRSTIAAVLVMALISCGAGLWRAFSKSKLGSPWVWMLVLFFLQSAAMVHIGIKEGHCPIRGTSEVVFFMGWALNLFYLLLGRMYRMSLLGIFTAPAIAVCMVIALLTYDSGAVAVSNPWLPWHIGFAMLAYGALGLAALAGVVFLLQDSFLKDHKVSGLSGKLPPVRTLHQSMSRLVYAGFLLLAFSVVFGYCTHLYITVAKGMVAGLICLLYLILALSLLWRGMPGRKQAFWSIALYVVSLTIFLVIK